MTTYTVLITSDSNQYVQAVNASDYYIDPAGEHHLRITFTVQCDNVWKTVRTMLVSNRHTVDIYSANAY
jgi:hypothetical protein